MEQSSVRTRRTHQQIRELLAEFSKAECTVKEFCTAHQISKATFHKWQSRSKVKSSGGQKGVGFTRVMVNSSSAGALFAEVSGIRFYQAVSASYLKELIV
jgi:hypothetical protein